MKPGIKLWLYGGALIIFGLFAVYSTSIWKSFDQRLTVSVMQNIETIKAFNTFLNDSIIAATQDVLQRSVDAENSGDDAAYQISSVLMTGGGSEQQVGNDLFPVLDTLNSGFDGEIKLVDQGTKKVQLRNNYVLFRSQIRNLVVSFIAVFFVFFLPLGWLKNKKFVWLIFIITLLFQFCAFIPALQATNGEARGWVDLGPLPNMQPSEFFKVGYVLFMAYWITKRKKDINEKKFFNKFFVQFTLINFVVLLIILCIPDMGTLFILALTGTIMAWYMGFPLRKILVLGGGALIIASVGVLGLSVVNPDNYAYSRIKTFFTTDEDEKKQIELREGWQIQQGLIAIGAGGFFGQGYGKGLQKMGQLPEAYSDMIFAAFSEEIGFVGNLFLIFLYIGMFILVLKRIVFVRDPQLRVLAVGIISLITVQVFVHIGVNIEILPNTGLTLPFVSHGGTALLINLVELMILYKILETGKDRVLREIKIEPDT